MMMTFVFSEICRAEWRC